VLAEYRRIARFLDKPPAAELSAADTEFLRGYLGAQRFLRYESEGYDTDTIRQAWLEHMSAAAAEGLASTLRIPLRTNVGWGCEVPSIWVATGNFDPNAVFILPEGDTTAVERCEACFELARRERCEEERCSLQVEGHFTGRTTQPTEHCQSTGYYFHIDRATTHGSGDSYFLALPGGAAPPDGPAITEGPRWAVRLAAINRPPAHPAPPRGLRPWCA
jgi:hypothetical protein